MAAPGRVPPRQSIVDKIVELDLGVKPPFDPHEWRLTVEGLVNSPQTFTWEQFLALPQSEITSDFHCVEGWSVLDQRWEGVHFADMCEVVQPRENAHFIYLTCADGYSTNLPLEAALGSDVMLARKHNGQDIPPDAGGPMRLVLSSRYAYKCAKWVRGILFLEHDKPGYWELGGYHNNADVWKEQRRG